jgi:hypothetical protein
MLLPISQYECASTSYVLSIAITVTTRSKAKILWCDYPYKRFAKEIPALLIQSQARSPISSVEVGWRFRLYLDPPRIIAELVEPERPSSTLARLGSSGGVKRSNRGRTSINNDTLIAPERLNIEAPKNVAAEGTDLCWNADQRATVTGRTIREYARG